MKNRLCIFMMQIVMIISCIVIYYNKEENVQILSYVGDEYNIAVTTGSYSYSGSYSYNRSSLPYNPYAIVFEKGDTYFINSNNINRRLKLDVSISDQGDLRDAPCGLYSNILYTCDGKKSNEINRSKGLIFRNREQNIRICHINNNYMLYERNKDYYVRDLDKNVDKLIGKKSSIIDENGNCASIEKGSILLNKFNDDNAKYISNDVSKIIGFKNNKIYFKKSNEYYFIHVYDLDNDREDICSLKSAYGDMYNIQPNTVFSDGNTLESLFINHNLDGSEIYSFKFCYNNNLIITAGKDMEHTNKIYMYNLDTFQKTTIFDLSDTGKCISRVYLLK